MHSIKSDVCNFQLKLRIALLIMQSDGYRKINKHWLKCHPILDYRKL